MSAFEIENFGLQIRDGINRLTDQRNILLSQQDNYNNLKHTIEANNKNGNNDEIMVMIGDGYFVNMKPHEANAFLNRRINHLISIIKDFDHRIQSSNEILSNFNHDDLIDDLHDRHDDVNHDTKHIQDDSQGDEKDDEHLPIMEIVEELDNDGNILNVKINNKNQFNEADTKTIEPNKTKSLHNDILQTPKEVSGEEEFIDIVEQLDDNDNIINVTSNGKTIPSSTKPDQSKPNQSKPNQSKPEVIENSKPSTIKDESESNNEDYDQMKEMLQDLEIKHDLIEKIDKLTINDEDKNQLKTIATSLNKIEELPETSDKLDEQDDEYEGNTGNTDDEMVPLQDHISIERKDLLELELIADDFQQPEGDYNFDEDFEFEDSAFEGDDDDFEDDDDDEAFFKDNKMNNLLWNQINTLRTKQLNDKQNDKPGKRVKFAENLDIFEVDKIKYDEPKRVSKFKQRNGDRVDNWSIRHSESYGGNEGVNESTINDVVENQIVEQPEPINEPRPKKVSRFKLNSKKNINPERPVEDVNEVPVVNDIVENPSNDLLEKPINDIVEKPINDIIEKPINNIVEKPMNDITENVPKRSSRFKQRNQKTSINDNNVRNDIEIIKIAATKEVNHVSSENPNQKDMDDEDRNRELFNMMKQYNEDTEDIEGPVIQEVKDIEFYNKASDGLDIDKFELHDHDHEHDHAHDDEHNDQDNKPEEKEDEIMTDIVEKENTIGSMEDIHDNFESDIKREYFKLKDKLNASKEFEIEKPKLSKFKSRITR